MFVVRIELKPSSIHGLGCFAAEPIKKGQLVWQYDPRVDIRIPLSELKNFPPAAQEILKKWTYIEVRDGQEVMVLCGDHAKFMNHSEAPNVYESDDYLQEFAARDIQTGEEVTCNYFGFDNNAEEKFGLRPIQSKG